MQKLFIYNTLSRKKEEFKPLNSPNVGLYVCGPTVYGDAHLGHTRPAITFDLLFRVLTNIGYKVRYVRNITDVGHLENDADAGEDKIAKKARLEQLEPMEVVQYYINRYHENMRLLNVLPPSIEPMASGHIIEQQVMVKQILENGFAYESGGSVYFDVEKYDRENHYGILSGRKTDELLSNTRNLEGQDEKRNPLDFAIWKLADDRHIMKWPSVWGDGFPGWHLECSVMSQKYLGEEFDIHGGGMDLLFPHHECEIAQTVAANGKPSVRYWMHNNMITIEGQKMGKSLGNFINLEELFSGSHDKLEQAYSPMTIRFFILQAHYRSTLDFSNDALKGAEKGLNRLFEAIDKLDEIKAADQSTIDIHKIIDDAYAAILDDLNSPVAIASLFEGVRLINLLKEGKEKINKDDLSKFRTFFHIFTSDLLGLNAPGKQANNELTGNLIDMLLRFRKEAKDNRDFSKADSIRDQLQELGIEVKDSKDGSEWKIL